MEGSVQAQEIKKEVTLKDLSPEEKKKVDEIAAQIDINDSQGIIQYGVGAQSNISNFADSILEQVKAKDAGEVGETLTDLMLTVKKLDVDSLSGESFMSKIPLIGNLVNSTKKFIAQYQSIEHHMEEIIDEMNKARMQLLKDITLLDALYEKNRDYMQELELYILAGEIKLKELNEKTLPELKSAAAASGDTLDAQKVQDLTQMINRFEKKVHDLKLSRMVSIQSLPQVRLIQNNDQLLVEKIQSSILNTIPLWKNQVVIAISLFRQKKAIELQKEVTETTNDLLQKNADLLKTSSLDVARESEKGIVEIDTLKKVHESLISTIDETLKIQAEGKTRRLQAEVEITKLENELKAKLAQVKSEGSLKL
ncbi:MAG TPA: toxic anion resistance protein [Spirochaetota bacterium]|nr:toxic anion resistance protein [Spirochaetota bacterium]HQO38970.1 toxic anion resistance protein [Spirochaetota bacterium]